KTHGALLYNGLLEPPGPNVYDAPRLRTYSEMLLSAPTMKRLCDMHGLDMTPADLGELFECTIRRDSDVMTVELSWASVEDGVAMLNAAMELLIDEAAERRRNVLRERMKQVEVNLLEARSELTDATER